MANVIHIDDDDLLLRCISRMCEMYGHEYRGYLSIDEAIAAGKNPDIVLLDRRGHGMSPEALLEKTRVNGQVRE